MKIGIDVRCLMAPNYSGVAEYTENLLSHLFQLDQQNEYRLFYNSQKDLRGNLPHFTQANVRYYPFRYPNKLFNFTLKYLRFPNLDSLLGQVDIFFTPNLNFLSLSSKCKKILTVHDLSFSRFPDFFSLKRRLWHNFINPKKLILSQDQIIADSFSTKSDLITLYQLPAEKIKVIHLGVDLQLYRKIESSDGRLTKIKNKYNLPKNFLLYLGTLEPRKNIEGIIEAFNLLKQTTNSHDLHLIIAGAKGWKYQRVIDSAQQSPYKEQIKFIGYIPRADKPFLYNLAQILLFPSFYEGFGLPVLEAQACQLPVIASINSSFPEIAGTSAFLINPDNLEEIKNAAQQLLNNKILRAELIDKGLKNCQRFSWQETARKTLKLLTTKS